MAIDEHADVYLGATFQKTVDFGGGPLTAAGGTDIALVRLSSFGKLRWAIRLGGMMDDTPTKIAVDSRQNVYVVGDFAGSADFAGQTLDAVCVPSATGCTDAFIASFTAAGTLRWAKALGGTGNDGANGVSVDESDDVYVGGYFEDEADVGGPTPRKSAGNTDVFLTSFDKDGGFRWATSFGGKGSDMLLDLAVRKGQLVVTGALAAGALIEGTPVMGSPMGGGFVASFDTSGKPVFSQGFGGLGTDHGQAVAIAEDGSLVVGGETYDGVVFGAAPPAGLGARNPFVAVLEPDGTPRWAQSYAASMYAGITGVGAAKDGSAYLAGYFVDKLTRDGETITSDGAEDMFLWHVTPP